MIFTTFSFHAAIRGEFLGCYLRVLEVNRLGVEWTMSRISDLIFVYVKLLLKKGKNSEFEMGYDCGRRDFQRDWSLEGYSCASRWKRSIKGIFFICTLFAFSLKILIEDVFLWRTFELCACFF
jgi:hypothetical protein